MESLHRRSSRAATRLCALALAALASCASDVGEEEPGPSLTPLPLTDTNPDPDVVEVELVASEGTTRYLPDGEAQIWGYRDGAVDGSRASVPGPTLEAPRGAQVVVHFRNELPDPTTVHWHGLRVPNAADGTPSVQSTVRPGERFDYAFVAGDAGTFWYHPHVAADVQVERGLYGAVVVRGRDEVPVDADRVLVLDDVKLEATGELSEDTSALDVMLGRQGNVVLANGVRAGRIVARSGARERWRFVNAANGRYFRLRLPGHAFRVIAWDGGLLAQPYATETLLVAPGERYEVLVELDDDEGSELRLETVHYDRGHDIPDPGPLTVLHVSVQGRTTRGALPKTWGDAVELEPPEGATERGVELSEDDGAGGAEPRFFLNERAFPDVPAIEARTGEVEVWRVHNAAEMDHPFHIHGLFFRVLDVEGVAPEHEGWKDTVNVPREQTVRLAVRYEEPGTWMYHCHILEHAERGMAAELRLARPGG